MIPVDELDPAVARDLWGLFTDLDDTLTSDGRLSAEAYEALWRLHEAGIVVVLVTGRPAGWCDLIARQWPVHGVIGENGALAFWLHRGRLHKIYQPEVAGQSARTRLNAVRKSVLREVPGSRVASDQAYRLSDLAIDICEEPPDLGPTAAEQVRRIFVSHGARAKVSSIHVNGWFGEYDKLSMVRSFCAARWGMNIDRETMLRRIIYCGDSPNDEPLFEHFPHACAVANIAPFVSQMRSLPRYLARGAGGSGFAEIAEIVLRLRAQPAGRTSRVDQHVRLTTRA